MLILSCERLCQVQSRSPFLLAQGNPKAAVARRA